MRRLFCIGYYWLLMVPLFLGGLINLLWMPPSHCAALIGKLLQSGAPVSRLTGIALTVWGAVEVVGWPMAISGFHAGGANLKSGRHMSPNVRPRAMARPHGTAAMAQGRRRRSLRNVCYRGWEMLR